MRLGKESRNAVEGYVVVAETPLGTTMHLRAIADVGVVPQSFLAKIFQKLTRANIVASSRGTVRSYALAHRSKAINVRDIFLAVEGSDTFNRCIFWRDRCAESAPFPMHIHWERVHNTIAELMERATVADPARDSDGGAGLLNPSSTDKVADPAHKVSNPDLGKVRASHS